MVFLVCRVALVSYAQFVLTKMIIVNLISICNMIFICNVRFALISYKNALISNLLMFCRIRRKIKQSDERNQLKRKLLCYRRSGSPQ